MKRHGRAATQKLVPPVPEADALFRRVSEILDEARRRTVRSINTWMVLSYWLIGREIVEVEQGGEARAKYGERLIEVLSARLTARFGRGFSVQSLSNFRDFFLNFRDRMPRNLSTLWRDSAGHESISSTARRQMASQTARLEDLAAHFHPALSWSHSRMLMRIDKLAAREFCEHEAVAGNWSVRQLERQIGSLYYERLLSSRNKRGVLKKQRQEPSQAEHPIDIIKDPYVLEFLNLPQSHELSETDLEATLIDHLQAFLLELGNGFAFIGRQQRLTLGRQRWDIKASDQSQ